MSTPTTFRGELRNGAKALNRRQVLLLIGTDAGTSPQNPVQAGLGITLEIRTGKQTSSITARMIYMGDANETRRPAVTFTQVSTGRWQAEGAAGGSNLGFLPNLDYAIAQPFELEVTVVYPGGRDTQRYGLWVGSGHHARQEDCHERDHFNVRLLKCCYNGQGFRTSENQAFYDSFVGGPRSEWDVIFDPGEEPVGSGWAFGVPNSEVERICDTWDNSRVYVPDAISGLSTGRVDNPFVNPTEDPPAPRADEYDMLPSQGRLDPVINRTAADIPWEASGPTQRPAPPWWPDPPVAVYTAWPDTDRVLKPMLDSVPAARPSSRTTGRLRGELNVRWITQNHPYSLGLPYEETIEVLLPTFSPSEEPATPPHLRFSLTGMDAGETVYLWCSAAYHGRLGPSGEVAHPIDVFQIGFTRLTNGGGPGSNFNLQTALTGTFSFGGGGSPQFPLFPRAITGLNQWGLTRPGGIATIGSSGALTFDLPADVDYMTSVANFSKTTEDPSGGMTITFQGVVCRPNTGPRPTLSSDPWGVDWPHSSYLTTISRIRIRRGLY